MKQVVRENPSYPVFKGLQRPLEFMMLRGRYIYWGGGNHPRRYSRFSRRLLAFRVCSCPGHRYRRTFVRWCDDNAQTEKGSSLQERV